MWLAVNVFMVQVQRSVLCVSLNILASMGHSASQYYLLSCERNISLGRGGRRQSLSIFHLICAQELFGEGSRKDKITQSGVCLPGVKCTLSHIACVTLIPMASDFFVYKRRMK